MMVMVVVVVCGGGGSDVALKTNERALTRHNMQLIMEAPPHTSVTR